jgi:hypothetical protein
LLVFGRFPELSGVRPVIVVVSRVKKRLLVEEFEKYPETGELKPQTPPRASRIARRALTRPTVRIVSDADDR